MPLRSSSIPCKPWLMWHPILLSVNFAPSRYKVGQGIETDMKCLEAIKDTVAPDVPFMGDANGADNFSEAIRLGRGLGVKADPKALEKFRNIQKRFCNLKRSSNTLGTCWNGLRPVTFSPLNRMFPLSGGKTPATAFKSFVFPAPLGPISPKISLSPI